MPEAVDAFLLVLAARLHDRPPFGLATFLWHRSALVRIRRSATGIGGWCLCAVAARIFVVRRHDNTGKRVLAVALLQAMLKLNWMPFPVRDSPFDLRLGELAMALTAAIATVALAPPTLTQDRKT